MEKLMRLIGWNSDPVPQNRPEEPTKPLLPLPHVDPLSTDTDESTRPVYRIGNRNPSDIYRVIDLSG